MTEPLHEILYCSVLAPGQPPDVVGKIVSSARAHNARQSITGLLVFDGMRFCQHFEGPQAVVAPLMQRIGQDPRHTLIRVAYQGAILERRYRTFDMGFAATEDPDDMAGIHSLDGEAALQRFLALRPGFDVSG
ncbi:MAG: BLUF domain-containing protein [Variovorax sp.]|nr:MAG: BLUF domain-containing protein [Variovorax sp.]